MFAVMITTTMRGQSGDRQDLRNQQTSKFSGRMKRYEVFPTQKPAPGDVAQAFELRDLQGNTVSLAELLKTKPAAILVRYFATVTLVLRSCTKSLATRFT